MATLSETAYAAVLKERLQLVKQLRALGAQAELDLPRICVMGGQSSGKSSLVEAISGIHVPRDAGTCTRCPIECRLTNSQDAWKAQVSIRWEYGTSDMRLNDIREVPFGDLITNPTDVEIQLRRAQAAVLSPSIDPSQFLTKSADDLQALSRTFANFSRDVVCIDISGPELTNLDFVDLPGLIQNASPQTVSLIENMVLSHIQGNSLILVTLPMSDDIENQKAVQLAKQVDPTGIRTIGVMTKPDTLTAGAVQARSLWLDVIEGRRHPTKHGYYCTRQPDEDERVAGLTFKEAREKERSFFMNTAPWATSSRAERFGTPKLIANLSRLLGEVIDRILPTLDGETSRQILSCSQRLALLPAPITSDPSTYVLNLITKMAFDCSMLVRGTLHPEFVQENRKNYDTYKGVIRASAPHFIPVPSASEGGDRVTLQDTEIEEDQHTTGPRIKSSSPATYLQDVRRHVDDSLTRELPHNVPYSAKTSLMVEFQKDWKTSTNMCFQGVRQALDQALSQMVDAQFGRFLTLKMVILRCIQDLLRSKAEFTAQHLAFLLQFERFPFTQHGQDLANLKDKYLSKYKDIRARQLKQSKRQAGPVDVAKTMFDGFGSASTSGSLFGSTQNALSTAPETSQSSGSPSLSSTFSATVTATSLSSAPATPSTSQTSRSAHGKKKFGGWRTNASSSENSTDKTADTPTSTSISENATANEKSGGFGAFWQSTAVSSTSVSQAGWGAFSGKKGNPGFLDVQGSGFGGLSTPTALSSSSTAFDAASASSEKLSFPPNTSPWSGLALATPRSGTPVPVSGTNSGTTAITLDESSREQLENQLLATLAQLGLTHVTLEDLGKLNPPDVFEKEMELMAEVRAYFHVSYKRITDYVPMTIDHTFLDAFASSLQETLIEKLGLGTQASEARCAAYLAEDEGVAAEHAELQGRLKRLEAVKSELWKFQGGQ